MNTNEINSIVLAYIGDCVYENYIRHYLVSKKIGNVDALQKAAVNFVSAKAQASFVKKMIETNFLSEDEVAIYTRIRNNNNHSHPKSCDVVTYRCATGLEGLIGYLDLENKKERINEIMEFIIGDVEC